MCVCVCSTGQNNDNDNEFCFNRNGAILFIHLFVFLIDNNRFYMCWCVCIYFGHFISKITTFFIYFLKLIR